MNAKDIIRAICQYYGETGRSLAQLLQVENYIISDITRGKVVKLSPKLRAKIAETFPNINPLWLATGKGEMLQQNNQTIVQTIGNGSNNNSQVATFDKLANEVTQLRIIIEKQQEANNKLLNIIDKLTN